MQIYVRLCSSLLFFSDHHSYSLICRCFRFKHRKICSFEISSLFKSVTLKHIVSQVCPKNNQPATHMQILIMDHLMHNCNQHIPYLRHKEGTEASLNFSIMRTEKDYQNPIIPIQKLKLQPNMKISSTEAQMLKQSRLSHT